MDKKELKKQRQEHASWMRAKKLDMELTGKLKITGSRKTAFWDSAYRRILSMSPEERALVRPANGYIEIALVLANLVCNKPTEPAELKRGELAVKVAREIREAMGEKGDSREKAKEEKESHSIINDLPQASFIDPETLN